MTHEQPLSLQKLDEAVLNEATKLLHEAGIYELTTYGWVDADTADPEFIGHAMWQTNGPSDVYLEYPYIGRPGRKKPNSPPEPEGWLKELAVSGADFGGLMQAAWMTIGLLLFQAKLLRENILGDKQFFDLHWMSSMIHLSTASDRLRALFVAAVFRKSSNKYESRKYNGEKRSRYTTPFKEAKDTNADPNSSPSFAKLLPMTDDINNKFRKRRNEIIHDVATSIGVREKRWFDDRDWAYPVAIGSYRDIEEAKLAHETAHENQITETIAHLIGWYLLLVRASNEVFIIEHELRRAAPKT